MISSGLRVRLLHELDKLQAELERRHRLERANPGMTVVSDDEHGTVLADLRDIRKVRQVRLAEKPEMQ